MIVTTADNVERLAAIAWKASQDAAFDKWYESGDDTRLFPTKWVDRTEDEREITRAGIRALLDSLYPAAVLDEEWCIFHARVERGADRCSPPAPPAVAEVSTCGLADVIEELHSQGDSWQQIAGHVKSVFLLCSYPVVPAPTETGLWPKWGRDEMQEAERILRLVSTSSNFPPSFRDRARIAAESLALFVAAVVKP